MSIEKTAEWLDENFDDPIKIVRKMTSTQDKEIASNLYDYLVSFGMYQPNRISKEIFHKLREEDIWSKVEDVFLKYNKKWNGPDVPVYVFPMRRMREHKSGVSFINKMFLFLTPMLEVRELEALIVHEYHHICRLDRLEKPFDEFTLLDSILMEGFAEFAVAKCCGKKYNAKWTSNYSHDELEYYWKKYFIKNLQVKRTDPLHDALLFGKGRIPDLIGYAVGYQLINLLYKKKTFTIKETFSIMIKEEQVRELLNPLD